MNKIILLFCAMSCASFVFAWEQTIINETSQTLTHDKKNLFGKGCLFTEQILKKTEATMAKSEESGVCSAVIRNAQGKKAELKCNEDGCELIQSVPYFSLERNNGSYSIKE